MQISVIIPSYNRLHTLSRAIESILSQRSPVDEIILVDDGSSDNTSDRVSQLYPDIRLIQQSNQGVSAARNAGIEQSRYDWIAFLDSDDAWLPDKISEVRLAHQQLSEIKLIHSNEIWVRNGIRVNALKKHGKSGGWIFEQCLPLCVISPSAVVMHRSLFNLVGLFDTSLPACEDYDLWLRICHRYPVHYIEQPLITKYGGHDDQLSGQHWGMDRFRIRSIYQLLQQGELSEANYSAALTQLISKLEILLKGARKHHNEDVNAEFRPILEHCLTQLNPQDEPQLC